ncbi:MAG: hypothetical protein GX663_00720 [Clostridiales bacterium]|nr:hypothetical protein [Clostridiales bacterium]
MSRNKVILVIALLVALYFMLPNDGIFHVIKVNAKAILPYILLGIIIYLVITINVLKKAWKKLDANINDENTVSFAKIMNISFDVKRMLGSNNLLDLYQKVNFSTRVSMKSKRLLFEAMRRKRLDVPTPGKGTDGDLSLRKTAKTNAEIKAARIEAAAKAKRKKNKK